MTIVLGFDSSSVPSSNITMCNYLVQLDEDSSWSITYKFGKEVGMLHETLCYSVTIFQCEDVSHWNIVIDRKYSVFWVPVEKWVNDWNKKMKFKDVESPLRNIRTGHTDVTSHLRWPETPEDELSVHFDAKTILLFLKKNLCDVDQFPGGFYGFVEFSLDSSHGRFFATAGVKVCW